MGIHGGKMCFFMVAVQDKILVTILKLKPFRF